MPRGARDIFRIIIVFVFSLFLITGIQACSSPEEEAMGTSGFGGLEGVGGADLPPEAEALLQFALAASQLLDNADTPLGGGLLDFSSLFGHCGTGELGATGEVEERSPLCDLLPGDLWDGLGDFAELFDGGIGDILNFEDFQGIIDGLPFTVNGTVVQGSGDGDGDGDGEIISHSLTVLFCLIEKTKDGDGEPAPAGAPPPGDGDGDGDHLDCPEENVEEWALEGFVRLIDGIIEEGAFNLEDLDFEFGSFFCEFNNELLVGLFEFSDGLGGFCTEEPVE